MIEEASSEQRPAVASFVNRHLLTLADKRRHEQYLPKGNELPAKEVSRLIDEFMRSEDGERRREILGLLLEHRLPEGALGETVRFVEWTLANVKGTNALQILNSFSGGDSFAALLAFAGSAYDRDVRLEAVRMMRQRALLEGQIDAIIQQFTGESDSVVRASLLMAVSGSSDPVHAKLFRRSASDPAEEVRTISTYGLDASQAADKEILVRLAQTDTSASVRRAALVRIAAESEDTAVIRVLITTALTDSAEDVRAQAIRGLTNQDLATNVEVVGALQQLSRKGSSEQIRRLASDALGRMGIND